MSILEGWLSDLTAWLKKWALWLWEGFETLMHDVLVFWVEVILDLFAMIIEAIPPPNFLTGHTLGGLLSGAGPTVSWLVVNFNIPACAGVIGAAYVYKVLRKMATLFQW